MLIISIRCFKLFLFMEKKNSILRCYDENELVESVYNMLCETSTTISTCVVT